MTPDEFKKWRKNKRVEDIADALGVHRATVFRWAKNGTTKKTDMALAAYDAKVKGESDG